MAAVTSMLIGASIAASAAGVYQSVQAKRDAKKEASKQQALVADQEAKIQAEKDKQLKEQQARRGRAQSQELLTGTETGITGKPQGTLLTGAK